MVLTDDISRYAAALLCNGFHNNVESALNESKLFFEGKMNLIKGDWEDYYLVHYIEDSGQYMAKHEYKTYLRKRFKW